MAPKKTAAEIDEMKRAAADPLSLSAEIEEMNMNRAGEAGATIAYELGLKIRKAFDSGAFGASVQGGVSDRTAQIIAAALTAGLQYRPPPHALPHFYDRVSLKPDTHLCVLCRQRPPWRPVTRRDEEEPYEERTVAV